MHSKIQYWWHAGSCLDNSNQVGNKADQKFVLDTWLRPVTTKNSLVLENFNLFQNIFTSVNLSATLQKEIFHKKQQYAVYLKVNSKQKRTIDKRSSYINFIATPDHYNKNVGVQGSNLKENMDNTSGCFMFCHQISFKCIFQSTFIFL